MCVCARADVPFGDGSGFRVWDLGLSNRTFGRRARNRAAPQRIGTCLSPPPLPFESARMSRERGWMSDGEGSADKGSKGENKWV